MARPVRAVLLNRKHRNQNIDRYGHFFSHSSDRGELFGVAGEFPAGSGGAVAESDFRSTASAAVAHGTPIAF
jgi:hypothetical protein